MAIALVGQNDATGFGTSISVALSVTSGHLLVFLGATHAGTGTHDSATDDQTQTWTQVGTPVQDGTAGFCSMWYCQNTYTGTLTVTLNLSSSDTAKLNLSAWSGQHATTPYVSTDTHPSTTATTHYHGDTGISAVAGQLLIGVAVQAGTISNESYSGSTPFTALQFTNSTNVRQWWGYRIAAGTESNVKGDWTQSNASAAGRMALFDQAAGGTAPMFRGS